MRYNFADAEEIEDFIHDGSDFIEHEEHDEGLKISGVPPFIVLFRRKNGTLTSEERALCRSTLWVRLLSPTHSIFFENFASWVSISRRSEIFYGGSCNIDLEAAFSFRDGMLDAVERERSSLYARMRKNLQLLCSQCEDQEIREFMNDILQHEEFGRR